MDTQLQAAPASIMFVIDDSGSMDWEFMTSQNNGIFEGEYYNFNMSDNAYSSSYVVSGDEKRLWRARWSEYNKMYYNPTVDYAPWPGQSAATPTAPRSDPMSASPTLNTGAEYDSVESGIIVDNTDPGFSKSSNGWAATTTSEDYGSDYYYTNNNDGTAWARWTVDIPTAGNYEISGWWRSHSSRVTNVTYDVYHNGILTQNVPVGGVNQNVLAQWTSLGTYYFAAGGGQYIQLNATVSGTSKYTADAMKFSPSSGSTISIKNAHYYTYSYTDDVPYLVVLDGTIKYYRFSQEVDDIANAGLILDSSPPDDVVPKDSDGNNRSYAAELQNFANWFSFYRRRELTAKAAISQVIDDIEGVKVGFYSIHGRLNRTVLPVNVTTGGTTYDNTAALLNLLYNLYSSGGTPLRSALKNVGDYFDQAGTSTIGTSPYESAANGGACQQVFAIVVTDGFWNGSSPGVGNQDGGEGAPYADNWSNTLADVAMKYYKTDLSTSLTDLVPTNYPDMANWQHMVTYGVSFGVTGTLNPFDYDLYNIDSTKRVYPTWPNPTDAENQERIDDLWHASVNGRGQFLSAANPENLIDALDALMENVMSRIGSGASISINGEELQAGSRVYQASYSTDNWTGDVKSYGLNQNTGAVIRDNYIWSASEELDDMSSGTRIIATYNTATSAGVPFQFNQISPAQQLLLDNDPTTAEAILNYLRGDTSNEQQNGGTFRNRNSLLGDIVHSSPVYYDDVIYAGANDGMLHAINASNGQELFAYVPGQVFPNLADLASTVYAHQYYVDLTPYVTKAGTSTLLVGGLGKGGRGYFCLDVTNAKTMTSETELAGNVKWEYPNAGTASAESNDLGFSFSEAYIVKSNDTAHPWVVVFGNGYASTNEHAVLFVLDAFTGVKIAQIDTGVGSCNGLSTPIPVDVNLDYKMDYVFAGDLKGNVWKFDMTGSSSGWKVAYKSGGTAKSFFRAKDAAGAGQPITTKPEAMLHCVPGMPGYMVVVGTGKYLGDTDFVNTQTQTVYGLWDYGDDADDNEYLGSFNRGSIPELSNQPDGVTLLRQEEIYYGKPAGSNYTLRVLSDYVPTWVTMDDTTDGQYDDPSDSESNNAGWYFDLPISKERVIRNFMIRDGKVILISSIPKSSPCSAGGDSILHEMNACTGGRMSGAQFDINDDGKIDANDMISIPDPNDPTKEILVAPTGIKYPEMIYPPKIMRHPDNTETKYFSTASGSIEMLREEGEQRGIFYWRERRSD